MNPVNQDASPVSPKRGAKEETPPQGHDARSNDPETWVDEHANALFRYAILRVRDRQAAEDLVQETFLAAVRKTDSFRFESSPRTWLIGILKHKIIDYHRKISRERAAVSIDESDAAIDSWFDRKGSWIKRPSAWKTDPSQLLEREEFWRVFEKCLSALPARMGEAFTLRMVDHQKVAQVCKVLAITPTNLWVILHRARARLRACLDTTWFKKED